MTELIAIAGAVGGYVLYRKWKTAREYNRRLEPPLFQRREPPLFCHSDNPLLCDNPLCCFSDDDEPVKTLRHPRYSGDPHADILRREEWCSP